MDPNVGMKGRPKAIHALLEKGCVDANALSDLLSHPKVDVNATGELRTTALHVLAMSTHCPPEYSDLLMQKAEIEPDIKDDKQATALIAALSSPNGHNLALKLLQLPIDKVSVSTTDRNGTNALSLASLRGWTDVRRILQRKDRSQMLLSDTDGMNVLTRAAYFGQKDSLYDLLKDCTAEEVESFSNEGRFNLVNLCAEQDWEDLVELLRAEYGLESVDQDTKGRTILHWAALSGWSYAERFHSDVQRTTVNVQDLDGCTPLHLAAEHRNLVATTFLLDQGANVMLRSKYGKTPVYTAAEAGSRAILEMFLDKRISEYGRDFAGNGLLHFVCLWEWPSVLDRYAKDRNLIINIKNRRRQTPLHFAAIAGNQGMLRSPLAFGANATGRDHIGFTPLLYAVQQGHLDVLSILLP